MEHLLHLRSLQFDRAKAARILHAHGITPTLQRVEIASVFLICPQHLSADQVFSVVNQGPVPVSKATVYNTLGLFVRKGLLREVTIHPAKIYYDSNTQPHHHFYDIETEILTDIPEDRIIVQGVPPLPEGTTIEGIDIIIRIRGKSS